jgi:Putative beta-barrel porin-2, OmpL-like. bbp2
MKINFLVGGATVALLAGLASVSPVHAQQAAPAANPMATPAMGGPITANPNPYSIDLGPILGKTYVTGAITGMGYVQNNSTTGGTPAHRDSGADLTNGMAEIQKIDGFFQYFIQAGAYSFPVIGQAYTDAAHTTTNNFGPLPQAYVKLAPTDSFSIQAGKLATLIGQELPFTYENLNIQRGLLWNQENLFNRGVQANYAVGPLSFSVSWNDGFYTNRYSYLTGLASWAVTDADTLTLAGGGNVKTINTSAGALGNEQQVDLSYTHNGGAWMVNPYIQYTHVPACPVCSTPNTTDGSTFGVALLVNYSFDDSTMVGGMSLGGFSLPARFEYITTSGSATTGPNLLYGQGSNAWELTFTPTYQYKIFFARTELSYISAGGSNTAGNVFGNTGNQKDQFRALAEAGFVF